MLSVAVAAFAADSAALSKLIIFHTMNAFGCDAATFGNHESDYGQDILGKRISNKICAPKIFL